jgi:hypothetical protein
VTDSTQSGSRWAAFTHDEVLAIQDGLMGEVDLDPNEHPSFVERVAIARRLMDEIWQHLKFL